MWILMQDGMGGPEILPLTLSKKDLVHLDWCRRRHA